MFAKFSQKLDQFASDQRKFEKTPHNNRQDILIKQADAYLIHLNQVRDTGKEAIRKSKLPLKFFMNRMICIDEYRLLMNPPVPFEGIFPCLIPPTSGPVYDMKLKKTFGKIAHSIFMTECALILIKAEDHCSSSILSTQ
jgi:hypothetical protein